ncbi:UBP1-associated protein 2B [Nymphaea thermarum]|nr:UBP1-associated protein 2B [Nymphaea thermarum]
MGKKRKLQKKAAAEEDSHQAEEEAQQDPGPDSVQRLLEAFSKEQLIELVCEAAAEDDAFLADIKRTADKDVAHRKIFVYGLGWDADRDALLSAFKKYGDLEDCNVVLDRATGRSKGYGFVLFRHRKAAVKALKEPQKRIKNRFATCQLASVGPVATSHSSDVSARKIYVSNVPADASPEKLRAMFARFGDLESGPGGFDTATGKSRGFALFLYKTVEGAKKALQEPYKMFEGHQLHVRKAAEYPKAGAKPFMAAPLVPGAATFVHVPAVGAGVVPAMISHGDLALTHAAGAVFPGALPMGSMVPQVGMAGSFLTAGGTGLAGPGYGQGLASYGAQQQQPGLSGLNSSVLGAYSMQGIQSGQLGQSSVRAQVGGSSLGGLPSYTSL